MGMQEFARDERVQWLAAALLLAAASIIGINQYNFGVHDQALLVPLLKYYENPALYPNDYVMPLVSTFTSSIGFATIAFLHRLSGLSLPALYFILYALMQVAALLGMADLTKALTGRREAAFLAMVLYVLARPLVAGVSTFDSELLLRVLALPFMLFGMAQFFRRRQIPAALLMGLAFLLHPLHAFDALIFLGIANLITGYVPLRDFVISGVILALMFSPALIAKYFGDASAGVELSQAWLDIMRLRSGDILFITTWPLRIYLELIVFGVSYTVCARSLPDEKLRRTVEFAGLSTVFLFVVGFVTTDIFPLTQVMEYQFYRAVIPLMFIGMAVYSGAFIEVLTSEAPAWRKLLFAALSAGYFVAGSRLAFWGLLMGVTLAWIAVGYFAKRPVPLDWLAPGLVAMAIGLGLATFLYRGDSLRISNTNDPDWVEVQVWAYENSSPDTHFIVPPYLHGFRVSSERAIYGDWKDGTMAFWDSDFGFEWLRRMEQLGFTEEGDLEEGYAALEEEDFLSIRAEMDASRVLLLRPAEAPALDFESLYENESFVVYELP